MAQNEALRYDLTMSEKILIPLYDNDVAPRFDLATVVLIVSGRDSNNQKKKTMVLPRASAEQLCHLIVREGIQTVICNGIEEDYFQYLKWKRVTLIDSVIGPSETALKRYAAGVLKPGDILS